MHRLLCEKTSPLCSYSLYLSDADKEYASLCDKHDLIRALQSDVVVFSARKHRHCVPLPPTGPWLFRSHNERRMQLVAKTSDERSPSYPSSHREILLAFFLVQIIESTEHRNQRVISFSYSFFIGIAFFSIPWSDVL
jgi:hypothetical protein